MRYFFLAYLLAIVFVIGIAGFRGDRFTQPPLEIFPDMDHQAKVKPQSVNAFFADGSGARLPVPGTVPMGLSIPEATAASGAVAGYGFSHGSDYYHSGRLGDFWGDGFPEQVTIDEGFLRLGQERYNIHCAVCHGAAGDGKGVAGNYGVVNIANFHDAKFTDPNDPAYRSNGRIFNTITNGQGTMGAYGPNIPVHERWAIVAWVRTLALSRKAPLSDPTIRQEWEKAAPVTAGAATPAAPATPQ